MRGGRLYMERMEKCPLEKVLEDTIKDYREWNFLKTEEGLESLVGSLAHTIISTSISHSRQIHNNTSWIYIPTSSTVTCDNLFGRLQGTHPHLAHTVIYGLCIYTFPTVYAKKLKSIYAQRKTNQIEEEAWHMKLDKANRSNWIYSKTC